MPRTIVIGDLHGCYDELLALLEKIGFGDEDRVVCVGDLIAKGPASKKVLDLFSTDSRFTSVIGNHDLQVLNHWKGKEVRLKSAQHKVLAELEGEKERYAAYLNSLPFTLDLGSYFVVHAGVRPGVPLDQQSPEDLVELRTLGGDRTSREGTPWYELYDHSPVILFGHWPAAEPRRAKYAIGLDTGCVYGHMLTGFIVERGEFIQVPAREVYEAPGPAFKKSLKNSLTLK